MSALYVGRIHLLYGKFVANFNYDQEETNERVGA